MITKWITKIVRNVLKEEREIDYEELAEELLRLDCMEQIEMEVTAEQVAQYFDANEVAYHMDEGDVASALAGQIDADDVAYNIDVENIAAHIDLDELADEIKGRLHMEDIQDGIVDKFDSSRVVTAVAELIDISDIVDQAVDKVVSDLDYEAIVAEAIKQLTKEE